WLIDWRALVSLKYTFCDVVQSWTCLLCATCPTAYTLSHLNNIIIVRLYSHKRHTATHTWIYGGDTGHTHTHTHAGRGRREFLLCIFPKLDCPSRAARSSGQPLGTRRPSKVIRPSWSGMDRRVFCSSACFVCWGS